MPAKPRAFRLDRPDADRPADAAPVDAAPSRVTITEEPLDAIEAADRVVVPIERRRGAPWGSILLSALLGLLTIALGFAAERLIADLFRIAPWLGWLALGLA